MTEVSNPKPLFFGSDSEEEEQASMNIDSLNEASTLAEGASKKRLFFPSSDDENDAQPIDVEDIVKRRAQDAGSISSAVVSSPPPRRAPAAPSVHCSSPPPPKKRKVTPLGIEKKTRGQSESTPFPPMSNTTGFELAYIGSFLVPNAWSTCKGRGWVKAGEEISIRRNEEETTTLSSTKASSTKAKAGKKVPGKQLKLTSMMKVKDKGPAPKQGKANKPDNVVRFTNSRGFGKCVYPCFVFYLSHEQRLGGCHRTWLLGLPNSLIKASSSIDYLLTYLIPDITGIITFYGCTMVDCADNLHTGAEMLLQLRVYILAEAFKQHRLSGSSDDPRSMFNEGQETLDEQNLRERKASLLQLFKAIDLGPRLPNAFLRDSNSNVDELDRAVQTDQAPNIDKKKRKAGLGVVDEGEVLEEDDDAELLSDGQLDMIYKKFGFVFITGDSE